MVHRDTQKGGVMFDIYDIIYDAIQEATLDGMHYVDPEKFERALTELGFMIVPIEDPTDLFGVHEDSL